MLEVALVLIVIALLIGGVLSARDLARAATIRSVIDEQARIKTAIQTFRIKYGAWPGDFAGATEVWGPSVYNGNEDSVISVNIDATGEHLYAWQHLARAGLIEGEYSGVPIVPTLTIALHEPGINIPRSRYEPNTGYVVWDNTQNSDAGVLWPCLATARAKCLVMGAKQYPPNSVWAFLSGALTPEDAFAIDAKEDDGLAYRGAIRGVTGMTREITTVYPTDACSDTVFAPAPAGDYNRESLETACVLIVQLER